MIHLQHVADSTPGPAYTHHRLGGLVLSHSVFHPGQWQTMRFPQDVHFRDLASSHIQPAGIFMDESGVLPHRFPGWISRIDDTLVPAGEYRRVAHNEVQIWCARNRDKTGDTAHVESLYAQDGQAIELQLGQQLMLVWGGLTLEGRSFAAPQHLHAQSAPRQLTAVGQVYAFRWTEPTPA